MSNWLLLEEISNYSDSRGIAIEVLDPDLSTRDRNLIDVNSLDAKVVFPRQNISTELKESALAAATATQIMLFKQNIYRSNFDLVTELSTTNVQSVNGKSGGLLFSLLIMKAVAKINNIACNFSDFAATGIINSEGIVTKVHGINEKIFAATSCLSYGSVLFFPKDNDAEITKSNREICSNNGISLIPVESLIEVAESLGFTITRPWVESPYLGLASFSVEHEAIYFGRSQECVDVYEKLCVREKNHNPGILILAESGIGKSSFMQAGLIPIIKRKQANRNVKHVIWRPSDSIKQDEYNLAGSLAASISTLFDIRSPYKLFVENNKSDIKDDAKSDSLLIICIDQLEELFSLGFSDSAQVDLCRYIEDLQSSGIWIIATMRNEFYSHYQSVCDSTGRLILVDVWGTEGLYDLKPILPEQIRQVIEGPASIAEVKFENGANGSLVEKILSDLRIRPDILPLLEFVLDELYKKRDTEKNLITFASYEQIGEIGGAIASAADAAIENLTCADPSALARVFRGLIHASSSSQILETARDCSLAAFPDSTQEYKIIVSLATSRLVVIRLKSGIRYARFAHESILTHWPEVSRFIELNRDLLRLRDRMYDSSKIWIDKGKNKDYLLLSKRNISDAKNLQSQFSELELKSHEGLYEFLIESIKNHKIKRRNRNFRYLIFLLIIVCLSLYLVKFAFSEAHARKLADQASNIAEENKDKLIVNLGLQTLENGDAMSGIIAALTVHGSGTNLSLIPEVRRVLLRGWFENSESQVLIQKSGIRNISYSKNGNYIVAIAQDNIVHLWDVKKNPAVEMQLIAHDDEVRTAIFGSDSTKLFTGDKSGRIIMWDLTKVQPSFVEVFKVSSSNLNAINALSFDQANSFLLASSDNGLAYIWEIKNGGAKLNRVLDSFENKKTIFSRFSFDGRLAVVTYEDGTSRIWKLDVSNSESIALLGQIDKEDRKNGDKDALRINHASFSYDNKFLATTSNNKSTCLWNLEIILKFHKKPECKKLLGHSDWVNYSEFTPDNRYLFTASKDSTIKKWDLHSTPITFNNFSGHKNWAQSLSISPSGDYLVSGSLDQTARLWNLRDNSNSNIVYSGFGYHVRAVAFSPDGTQFAAGSLDGTIRIFDLNVSPGRHLIELGSPSIYSALSPNGRMLFSVQENNSVLLWNIENRLPVHFSMISNTASKAITGTFNFDASLLLLNYRDGASKLWKVDKNMELLHSFDAHRKISYSFFQNQSNLNRGFIGYENGDATIFSYSKDGVESNHLSTNLGKINHAEFDKNSKLLAIASDTGVSLWDIENYPYKQLGLVQGESGSQVDRVALSPDGKLLAAARHDNVVGVWNLNDLNRPIFLRHKHWVRSVAFSENSKYLVSASNDQTVKVWNVKRDFKLENDLGHHQGSVINVFFHKDDSMLISESNTDGSIILWDISQKRPIPTILKSTSGKLSFFSFSQDRSRLSAMEGNHLIIWDIPNQNDLIDFSKKSMTRCLTNKQKEYFTFEKVDAEFLKNPNEVSLPPCS